MEQVAIVYSYLIALVHPVAQLLLIEFAIGEHRAGQRRDREWKPHDSRTDAPVLDWLMGHCSLNREVGVPPMWLLKTLISTF